MCCFKTLYRNDHGYVTRCDSCRHLHIAFGTTVLALNHEQFLAFAATVNSYYEANRRRSSRDQKNIQIPTIVRSIILLYTVNELEHFTHLLQHAKDALRKEQLFVFNQN